MYNRLPHNFVHSGVEMDSQQQQFCLKWNSFGSNLATSFSNLFKSESLADVTLFCDGVTFKAHKLILAACSKHLADLFETAPLHQNLLVILDGTSASNMSALLEFMYKGEVHVSQDSLSSFLKAAECLQVKGLSIEHEKLAVAQSVTAMDTSLDSPRKHLKEDIEELNRLAFEEIEEFYTIQAEEHVSDTDESETDDRVELRSVDSNTDHEISDQELSEEGSEEEQEANYFLGKDGTRWSKTLPRQTRMRPHNILMKLPGVIGQAALNAKTETHCWDVLFSTNILNLIVGSTNQYIDAVKEKFQRERDCRPTDQIEIKAFMGLLYLAGVFRGGHRNLQDFWTTDGLGIDVFRMTMSEKRFRFLLRCVRFDDRETRQERRAVDKLAAIRELFTCFIENCKSHYHISQNVTIDEMLPGYRGRCAFRQYIPSKPNKYGIKIFCLSDAKLFYTTNMEIYCGQQPEGPFRISNSSKEVVLRLAEPIFQSGRNITADNWFSSLELVRQLENKKLSYVGTIRKNKRELPPAFVLPRGRGQFDSIFGFSKNETLVSYVPKKGKTVVLISSMHIASNEVSDDIEKKPEIITFYNETKSGVDVVDKLCAQYNVARCTKRWPMVIFYHLLNVAGINARVIYMANKNEFCSRRQFLKALSLALLDDQLKRRAQMTSLPREIKSMLIRYKPSTSVVPPESREAPPEAEGTKKRKRCHLCYAEEKNTSLSSHCCQKCGIYLCMKLHVETVCSKCLNPEQEEDVETD